VEHSLELSPVCKFSLFTGRADACSILGVRWLPRILPIDGLLAWMSSLENVAAERSTFLVMEPYEDSAGE
jgi:hypothetical protein